MLWLGTGGYLEGKEEVSLKFLDMSSGQGSCVHMDTLEFQGADFYYVEIICLLVWIEIWTNFLSELGNLQGDGCRGFLGY